MAWSAAPCQISSPSLQRVAPMGQKTQNGSLSNLNTGACAACMLLVITRRICIKINILTVAVHITSELMQYRQFALWASLPGINNQSSYQQVYDKLSNLHWWTTEFCLFHILRGFLVLLTVRIVVCVFGAKSVQRQNRQRLRAAVKNMLHD